MMKMEGVEFREALRNARRSGGNHPGTAKSPAGRPAPAGSFDKRALYRAMAWAEKQYHVA